MTPWLLVVSSVVWLMVTAVPAQAGEDSRLRTLVYDAQRVVPVYVEQGFAVQIVLAADERIEAAGTGTNSHCEDSVALWCVVAHRGEHDVYVNVHPGATPTNLFVQTDRRNYSFDLIGLPPSPVGQSRRVYRIQFTYPDEIATQLVAAQIRQHEEQDQRLIEARLAQPPVPRNWNYTMQTLPGGEKIEPTMMYDDGRFTYLKFPNNREIPSIYMVSEDGSESLVQWHMENDVMVVHRVGKRFVLRDDKAVVGLWNEAYDADGVPPHDGVTVPGLVRRVSGAVRSSVDASETQIQPETEVVAPRPTVRATRPTVEFPASKVAPLSAAPTDVPAPAVR